MNNPLCDKDGYKVDHNRQYPDGTTLVFSNFTPRSSRIAGMNEVVFFGLQYFVKRYLIQDWNENFFQRPKAEVVKAYKREMDSYLGKDAVSMKNIEELHDLGYLPIRIMALPEGSRVPIGVAPFIIFNTHDAGFWLPNALETIASCSIWQPCTSATISDAFRRMFEEYATLTGGDLGFVPFQGHDFSFRGMSSRETACLSGGGHALSFLGSDTVPVIPWMERYYNANCEVEPIILGCPATEHSVMCMGQKHNELQTIDRLLDMYPTGVLSVVSDTWDYWHVLTNILPQLKGKIMARNGKYVTRPDSSPKSPLEIICGDPDAPVGSNEWKGSIRILWEIFGGTINKKGFKELDSHVGLIYGDSITLPLAMEINQRLMEMGFASTNWVAGIGSFTYQYNTRDTFGWAMKATFGIVEDEGREIFKDPKTNKGPFSKKSAKGLISVFQNEAGKLYQRDQVSWDEVFNCEYEDVFHDGCLDRDESLAQIRNLLTSTRGVL